MHQGTTIVGWFMFSIMSVMLTCWLVHLFRLRRRGEYLWRRFRVLRERARQEREALTEHHGN